MKMHCGNLAEEGFVYRTSELGEFQGLENGEVLVEMVTAAIDSMFATMDENKREAGRQLLDVLGSPEVVEGIFTEPIALYHQLHGYQYMVQHPWRYEKSFPNRFGGDPIPALGEAIVEDPDPSDGLVTLRSREKADSLALLETVMEVVAMAGTEDAEEIRKTFEGLALEMFQEDEYLIDYETGWIKTVKWFRVVESAGTRQEQYYEMRLIDE